MQGRLWVAVPPPAGQAQGRFGELERGGGVPSGGHGRRQVVEGGHFRSWVGELLGHGETLLQVHEGRVEIAVALVEYAEDVVRLGDGTEVVRRLGAGQGLL